jgi:hypothetical protein
MAIFHLCCKIIIWFTLPCFHPKEVGVSTQLQLDRFWDRFHKKIPNLMLFPYLCKGTVDHYNLSCKIHESRRKINSFLPYAKNVAHVGGIPKINHFGLGL